MARLKIGQLALENLRVGSGARLLLVLRRKQLFFVGAAQIGLLKGRLK